MRSLSIWSAASLGAERSGKGTALKDLDFFFENNRVVLLRFVCTTGFDDIFSQKEKHRRPSNGIDKARDDRYGEVKVACISNYTEKFV